MTDSMPSAEPGPQRQIPVEALLARYRNELAGKTEALFVAESTLAHAEAECAALRLRVVELEGSPAAR